MIYCFDIDGTLCQKVDNAEYMQAHPLLERIRYVNHLYDNGNYIKLFTARGSTTGIDWYEDTQKQLKSWGLRYHELILGKPEADLYVDDRGINSELFIWK